MWSVYNIVVGKREGKDHSEDGRADGMITSEWILGKQGGKVWSGYIWLRIGTSGELLWTG
jgi:hypothetical protein